MRLDLIQQYLIDHGVTVPIYIYRADFAESKNVLLRLPLEGVQINWYIPGYYNGVKIQAIVRAETQADGDTLAADISRKLTLYKTSFQEGGVEKMFVNQLLPLNLPIVYPRSDGQGIEWSIEFTANFVIPG